MSRARRIDPNSGSAGRPRACTIASGQSRSTWKLIKENVKKKHCVKARVRELYDGKKVLTSKTQQTRKDQARRAHALRLAGHEPMAISHARMCNFAVAAVAVSDTAA